MLFGLATLIEATIPIPSRCDESIKICGISPPQIFSVHDLASIIAVLGLLLGLFKGLNNFKSNKEMPKKIFIVG